jgi:chemotaxis protein MotB
MDDKQQVIVKVKRKRGHGGHHGGAWKVAYADFVTAMMALFIVLWLLTQADLELRQAIARYFRNASVLSGGSMIGAAMQKATSREHRPLEAAIALVQGTGNDLEALRARAGAIERALEKAPDLGEIKDLVDVAVTATGLEIQIIDSGEVDRMDLLFEIGSAELKPELVKLLRTLAAELGKLPNRLRIGGHTDARPFASASGLTNWDLAFARANNARKILEGNGLRPKQVLAVEAYASRQPLKPEDPLAQENRRLSVVALREPPEENAETRAEREMGTGASADMVPDSQHDREPVFAPRFDIPGLPPS